MIHSLFPSVEAMLAPETLSELTGQPITAVSQEPLWSEYGRSGSRILSISTNDGKGSHFILKRVSLNWDWLMRTTADTNCRSVTLWQHGILDQVPPEIAHGVVSCARDETGWAILMEDVGDKILPYAPFTLEDISFFLNAMAAFHTQFWQQSTLTDPQLALCTMHNYLQMFSPRSAEAEKNGDNNIPRRILEGWELAKLTLPKDIWQILQPLLDDPTPLCNALAKYPYTLVHGDWRHSNQAYAPGTNQLYLLDWQLALAAPPSLEMARFLITCSPLLPFSKDAAIEQYRQNLAARLGERFSETWWQPQLSLGLLSGFLQDGWALLLKASHWHVGAQYRAQWKADIPWWLEQVRHGATYL